MAPAEPAPKTGTSIATDASIDWRNFSKAKGVHLLRPKIRGVNGSSKPQSAKPLTKKARRIIVIMIEKLMRKRDELDKMILSQASRPLRSLNATDFLFRERALRQSEQLTRREGRYVQTLSTVLAERTRLYKRDPSAERVVDLDFTRELLLRFSRHLDPNLVAAEKPKEGRVDDDRHTSRKDSNSSGDVGSEDRKPSATGGLDGAFDDTIASKKRKSDDPIGPGKEPHKKTKKEQTNGEQSSALKIQIDKPIASQRSQGIEASIATIKAEINILSQTKTTTGDGDMKEKADRKAGRKAKETTSLKSASDNGGLTPFYMLHAKAMVHPEFNDHVHDRPANRRGKKRPSNRPIKEYHVRGALPDPHASGPKQHSRKDQGGSQKRRR
ncbi:hypothetical protein VPNG_00021 [Cytospora leucostoma]|uniref:Uncharacterized protein n=1 Tax=Cytospora leucostoma TaxID=1230097 RepID=A0A423XNU6_9PEZI|nr:hypothetical protein VPNG_00021 [Cytospora leucostoma]